MKNKKIILIGVVLILIFAGLTVTMLLINSKKKETIPAGSFMIVNGETKTLMNMEELKALGIENFDNYHRNSRGKNELVNYGGVELKTVLSHFNIPLDNIKSFTLYASDGFAKIYSIEDVTIENNVYITVYAKGEPLITGITGGNEEDGGPYVIIKCNDYYSENRVKKFNKVVINYD
jgi:hypothetical protein